MKKYNPKKPANVIYVFNNDINRAIGQLRHKSSALMKELKDRRYYKSDSDKRKEKLKAAKSRERARIRKLDLYGW